MSRKGEPMNRGLQLYAVFTVRRLQSFIDSDQFTDAMDFRLHFDENIEMIRRFFLN